MVPEGVAIGGSRAGRIAGGEDTVESQRTNGSAATKNRTALHSDRTAGHRSVNDQLALLNRRCTAVGINTRESEGRRPLLGNAALTGDDARGGAALQPHGDAARDSDVAAVEVGNNQACSVRIDRPARQGCDATIGSANVDRGSITDHADVHACSIRIDRASARRVDPRTGCRVAESDCAAAHRGDLCVCAGEIDLSGAADRADVDVGSSRVDRAGAGRIHG